MKEYAVYKGESLVCIGTIPECAAHLGVKEKTVRHYSTPAYKRLVDSRKKPRNYVMVVRLDEE